MHWMMLRPTKCAVVTSVLHAFISDMTLSGTEAFLFFFLDMGEDKFVSYVGAEEVHSM